MNLRTPTRKITPKEARMLVTETIEWCKLNLGIKKTRTPSLKFSVRKKHKLCYACYNYSTNTIIIYKDETQNVREIIKNVIHEYTHHIQNLRLYNVYLMKLGYKAHPQEIEAQKNEERYKQCWSKIKNKLNHGKISKGSSDRLRSASAH